MQSWGRGRREREWVGTPLWYDSILYSGEHRAKWDASRTDQCRTFYCLAGSCSACKDDSKDESLVFSRICGSARASNAVGEYRFSSMASCGTRLGIRMNGPRTAKACVHRRAMANAPVPDSAASEAALFRAWSCFALGLRAVAVCVRHDGQQLLARLASIYQGF